MVAFAETYAEGSPSGKGLRLFARGKPAYTVPSGPDGVEIYGSGRYLTVTGQHLSGTPDEIRPAPKALARLLERVEEFRPVKGSVPLDAPFKPSTAPALAETVENVAMTRSMLAAIDGNPSVALEHDICHGEWLRVVFALLSTGWNCAVELAREWSSRGSKWDETAFARLVRSFKPDKAGGLSPRTLDHIAREHGYVGPGFARAEAEATPAAADGPLPLFPELPPAEPYPVAALGPVLGEAARAIVRKIQVPEAMAAQSVLSAASLAAQALADVMLPYGQTRPLSLFLVTVAASG